LFSPVSQLVETRVRRLLLSVVGRAKPKAPQRLPPFDWEAWTAEHQNTDEFMQ